MPEQDPHREEMLEQARTLVAGMEQLDKKMPNLPPGTFSMQSISIEDSKFALMPRFVNLLNACRDAELQEAIIDIVRQSRLSLSDKAKLYGPLGLEQ